MFKYLFFISLFFILLNAKVQEVELHEEVKKNQFAMKFLEELKTQNTKTSISNEEAKEILSDTGIVKNQVLSKKEELYQEFNTFINALELFEDGSLFKEYIVSQYSNALDEITLQENKQGFTLFYFVSESIKDASIDEFSKYVDKLHRFYPEINAYIIFNGYPAHYETSKTSIEKSPYKQFLPNVQSGKYGDLEINENGEWTYTVRSESFNLFNNDELEEILFINDIKGNRFQIDLELKRFETSYKVKQEQSPMGMYRYLLKLKKYGVSSKNVNIKVHPWAFEYFKLHEVPAYALSYCNKDFRFKECRHEFLMKGNTTLPYFFDQISNTDEAYNTYYLKLIEAE